MKFDAVKPLELEDKKIIDGFLRQDPPQVSELTFTNLYIWRHKYRPLWFIAEGCLLLILRPEQNIFGLQPIGNGDKAKALERLVQALRQYTANPMIGRVDEAFRNAYADEQKYVSASDRDNSDYVYRSEDLIQLAGNKYHRKKNQLNQFTKHNDFTYRTLDPEWIQSLLDMQEDWCQMRECRLNPELLAEDYAVREALMHYADLGYAGSAILINRKVEAFTLGEPLNPDTAVIHIEKANPDVPGLYTAINHFFCKQSWSHMAYINREQDLGVEGLRKAKESYYPHHLVHKYTIKPR